MRDIDYKRITVIQNENATMQNTPESPYWETINNSLWKQQHIIGFIDETLGDLYLTENSDDLKRLETRLTAIDALIDSLKTELNHIMPLVQQKRDEFI
ncbi:hypothetical protein [Candidatus Albibeggiatoa sp. nov. NOAA]|uniref:hypothetical protein n=1 Tax=Candidatus Albibeggiatoa sp. nov. NOAA TaxID=3162724 RepID=UPI0032F79F7A|nr:hypothetical protein [Thiotrichaceae bacterium]